MALEHLVACEEPATFGCSHAQQNSVEWVFVLRLKANIGQNLFSRQRQEFDSGLSQQMRPVMNTPPQCQFANSRLNFRFPQTDGTDDKIAFLLCLLKNSRLR